jgi:predicted nucleic acid-binding protein
VVAPTLLLVEVAAAVARAYGNPTPGIAFAQAIRELPNLRWEALDESLAGEAAELAAVHRLRGADAVYGALAHRHGSTLITLDRQQLERLKDVVPVGRPE